MSTRPTRRRHVQRFGLAGIGSAVLFVGIAAPAGAATDVVIPLAPTQVVLIPTPEGGAVPLDPTADPFAGAPRPVVVQYGETLTVDLPDELDPTEAVVEIAFTNDADGDRVPDQTYSSASTTDPLDVTVVDGNDLEIVLPADDTVNGPLATLAIAPLDTALGAEFTVVPSLEYELDFSAPAPTGTVLLPELVALAQVPCDLDSTTRCPVAVTASTTLTLDLTANSALRDLGLDDLTGIEVALQSVEEPTATPVLLDTEVSGSTATTTLPAGLAEGTYALVLGQPITSGLSIVVAELAVSAPAEPEEPQDETPVEIPVETPAAAPSTQAVADRGLRSNTGVTAPVTEATSAGSVAVPAGAGLLLLAGAGGVAVARGRRRPAADAGTGEA